MNQYMQEIIDSTEPTLTPNIVARALGINPQAIRVQAHKCPEMLGFPVFVCGSRVHIPRQPFIDYIFGTTQKGDEPE